MSTIVPQDCVYLSSNTIGWQRYCKCAPNNNRPANLQQLVSDLGEEPLDVVAGLRRRLEEVHPVALRKFVADFRRNFPVVAVGFVACNGCGGQVTVVRSCVSATRLS